MNTKPPLLGSWSRLSRLIYVFLLAQLPFSAPPEINLNENCAKCYKKRSFFFDGAYTRQTP